MSSDIQGRLDNMMKLLRPVSEKAKIHSIFIKQSTETSDTLKRYLDLDESIPKFQKILLKDGCNYTNRDAYLHALLEAKSSYNFLKTNAPYYPSINEWKSLVEESIVTVKRVFVIEYKNFFEVNAKNLKDAVNKWTLDGIIPNFEDQILIFHHGKLNKPIFYSFLTHFTISSMK
ncbi:hypothetical protein RF11_07513 [Thelohanellus kitauei]|uniref:Uncharacterized protein n=1 Tax=Thelohanellus kitauei TaxID=669202 RepID=A0A0C2MIY6_THEKT|nr:hypothetical protein RF11_07513 [Thelohanellus kitauei]